MSFDGTFTHSMVHELQALLTGGRLSKIQQPYEMEIILTIRSHGKNHKLLLSAHPTYARVQITTLPFDNPVTPPNFTMMLRKYLEGGILESIQQVANDRVLHFYFSKRNELGDLENLLLVVELMGRHSTILLLNKNTQQILDAIKHVGPSQNSFRLLLPGATYHTPPLQDVLNPFVASDEEIFHLLQTAETLDAHFLQQHFQGLGFDTAAELIYRLQQKPEAKMQTWRAFFAGFATPVGTLSQQKGKEFFSAQPFKSLTTIATYPTLSTLLDAYYGDKAEKDRVKQMASSLLTKITNEFKKNQKKLKKLQQTLADTENAEDYRRRGELLTTFLHEVPRGVSEVTLKNYYEEDAPIKIALRLDLTPNQNAQKYFQKYQKAKNAIKVVEAQIVDTEKELAYLQSVLDQLALATPLELAGIKEELQVTGYVKAPKKKMRQNSNKPTFQRFIASSGDTILIGRNNLQNDQLTLKTAKKTDIWLHVKNIPGSHVIIQNPDPSPETLQEAAQLAAYFSKYRLSSNVPVDYVAVRYVHKPNGAKPGFVIYENQNTLYVTPQEELVNRLKVK